MSDQKPLLDLTGRVAIITGSVGNLGAATAALLQRLAARTVLVDRSADRLAAAYPQLKNSTDHLLIGDADLSSVDSVRAVTRSATDRFGRIDILVNTVGAYRGGKPLHESNPEDWDFLFETNVRTTLNTCRAVLPTMLQQRSGRIINIGSRAALSGEAGLAAYSVAKTAVLRLTESLSRDVKRMGVNVNCVLPGTIDTPQNRAAMPGANHANWVAPEAIAGVIAFLASDAAGAIHGTALPVYGLG